MNDNLQPMKIFAANVFSWSTTLASMQMVADVLHIFALVASLGVSVVSCWWIIKQANNLDRIRQKQSKENEEDASL
jgi:hypothetical protein